MISYTSTLDAQVKPHTHSSLKRKYKVSKSKQQQKKRRKKMINMINMIKIMSW